MKPLKDCRLYGILDTGYCHQEAMPAVAKEMVAGGVDIIQLRAKELAANEFAHLAATMRPLFREAGVPFIVNDHARIAGAVEADGVHVGQDDMPLSEARRQAGRTLLLGKSTHSLQQASAAEEECADYIGFGPLFATPTKPDYSPIGMEDIATVHRRVKIPIFCIGGIKRENLERVLAAGARRVVIVSGILQASDIRGYCAEVKAELLQR